MTRFRALEAALLFFVLPVLVWQANRAELRFAIPALLLTGAYCAWRMLRSGAFAGRDFVFPGGPHAVYRGIVLRWAAGAGLLAITVWRLDPESFLAFPRERPWFWLLVMLLYPLLSVYPQELVYRPYLFHAFPQLHRHDRTRFILWSSSFYSFAHLLFENWPAIVLTFAGGLLFSRTYWTSRSLAAAWLEHSLWGNTLFTIGLGRYLYSPLT